MKAAFYTLGCKVNQYDTQMMSEKFLSAGHTVVGFDDDADIYIINTCTVTQVSDKKSRNMISRVRRAHPNAVIAVCGCFSQVSPEQAAALSGVGIVLGTRNRADILYYVNEYLKTGRQIVDVQSSSDIADETMFERLNDSDGICQYYVEDQVHASRWAVQAVVLANLNGSRQVLVVSRSQANMDALMKLLTSRYLLVTVTVLILALILSVCLAEYFARPFRHLNKSALQMAAGDYETEFMREGPLEARQLADTLELAEQEFNKTEALRRDFVANVSHDMKTPLTVIRMYAEMLEAFSGEIPEKREEHVRMILDETDRLTNFISDTLDLAKLQSGTMEMHPSVFAIQDVAEEVLSSVCANKPEFQFKMDCPESMLVYADRKLIYRVIYNFASNAVKFSGERQEARILVRRYQGSVRVEVIDYGIGIEKDKLPYIWNRFYQAKPNDRQKSGMGVGLNIASEILRLHHAPFGAESTPNEGTCFWFMLEACEDET